MGGCYISQSVIVETAVSLTCPYSLRINFDSLAVVRSESGNQSFAPKLRTGNGC